MNTTASYPASDHSWRRTSTETVFSLQGKETDFARDTSDTEAAPSDTDRDHDVEYEPVTEPEDGGGPVDENTSAESENEIISTKVIEVSVGDDGDLQFADAEQTDSYESDSEMDLYDFWHCVQCRVENNNPLYRYCQKCFTVRKNFFPPRPKPKHKRESDIQPLVVPRTLSQDSGVEFPYSQEVASQESADHGEGTSRTKHENEGSLKNVLVGRYLKRRAESADRNTKRVRLARSDSDSDLDSDYDKKSENVQPLVKMVSDPSITIEESLKVTKKVIANTLKEKLEVKDLCVICISEPKSGVFVHGRIAHICCCYKCAVKVWAKAKRCPVCNCKVSNVLRAVVM